MSSRSPGLGCLFGCALLFVALVLASAPVRANVPLELRGQRVVEVRIDGATEGFTTAREIGIPLGAPVSRRMLRSAVRRLVESGRWADVQLDLVPAAGGVRVVAHLVPRLVVSRLEVLGNKVIDDSDLRRLAGMRQGAEFLREQLEEVASNIEQAYTERGYEHAYVRIQVWDTDDPSLKVVRLRIHEGEPIRITRLGFAGERPPPHSGAIDAIGLELGDVLDRRKVREAVRRGEEELREGGWLEARLGPARLEPHEGGMAVIVPSRVGPRYQVVVAGARPLERQEVVDTLRLGEERLSGAAVLEAMRARVTDLYRKHGFHEAQVRVIPARGPREGTARLLVAVEPGEQLDVIRVTFPGARHFDRPFLRSQVFSFLQEDLGGRTILQPVDAHTIDQLGFGGTVRGREREVPPPLIVEPEKIYYAPTYERAVEHLRELYQSDGYLEAEVGPARLERLETGGALVVIPVVEGPRTMLYGVSVEGNEAVATRPLLEGTELRRGMPFSHLALEKARIAIRDEYRSLGYLYARVDTDVRFSGDRTRARVTFHVVERYPVHIGRVVVEGARRTKESLIRDRVGLEEGALYSPKTIREAQARLMGLGVFNSVNVGPQDPELPERVKNVVVTVTERPTQFIDFSAGLSTGEGVRGGFEYGYRNLFGYAVGLSLRVQLGHQFFFLDDELQAQFERLSLAGRLERLVTLGLTIPHIHGMENVTTSVNLFHQRENERGFGLDKNGLNVTLAYRPLDWLTVTVSEDLENNDLEILLAETREEFIANTPDRRLQELLRVPEGRSTLVASRGSASFDFRDNPFVPTTGVFLTSSLEWARTLKTRSVEVADMRQDFSSNHFKVVLGATGYVPLAEDVVLATQVRYGRVIHLSDDSETYPNRQFFLGGADSLRGFRQDQLIPQDLVDDIQQNDDLTPQDVLRGGDTFVLLRSELRFPIVGDVQGGLFADVGNIWLQAGEIDLLDLRPTAGVGLRIATPVGPLAFDYGVNILRRNGLDEPFGAFHFSIGVF